MGDKEGQRTYEQKERYIRKDKSKKDKAQEKSREVVTVPYVHSFTEKIQRMFTKHRVATVVSTLNHPQTGFSSPEGQSWESKKGWSGVQNSMQPMRKGIYR